MNESCRRGHVIRGSHDRLPSGYCRMCDSENQSNYRARQRAGLDLLRAYESLGAGVSDIPRPHRLKVALAVLDACPEEQLRHLALMDPDLVARALANVTSMLDAS